MAIIPGLPGPGGVSVGGGLNVGAPLANPHDFGQGKFRDLQHLGQTIQRAGHAVMDYGIGKYEDRAQTEQRNALVAFQDEYEAVEREELKKRGRDAQDADKRLEETAKQLAGKHAEALTTPRARELFQTNLRPRVHQSLQGARRHINREDEIARVNSLDAANDRLLRNVKTNPGELEWAAREMARNIRDRDRGQDEETLANAIAKENITLAAGAVNALGESSPEEALKMLNDPMVREMLGPEAGELKAKYGKEMIAGARKQAENEMRRLGISLGDTFDNEYEIIDALRDIEDRELAKIAREEAETVRKARLALGGEKKMTPEEKARDDRVSRGLADTIIRGADQDDPGDDVATEEELGAALDKSLSRATETRREKVRKYAVARLKARRAAQARDRRILDQQALETMAKASWDVSAIDPDWPDDLQDKMMERAWKRADMAEKRENRQEKEAKKAAGLEYLEMPLDELNDRIREGEWPDIVDLVGAGTPEYTKLERRLTGEDKSNLTMLQYAKNEFTRIVGNPNKKKKRFAEFNRKVDEARSRKAKELKLDNPDMIPEVEQKSIVNSLLIEGDFRWFESLPGPLSPNKYRFEVEDDDLSSWKPFDASATSTEQIPEFAKPYLGPRDARREVLRNGAVLIESSGGAVTIVKPDGSMIEGNQ